MPTPHPSHTRARTSTVQTAFRLLLERMQTDKRQLPPRRLMLVPELIERESVADLR